MNRSGCVEVVHRRANYAEVSAREREELAFNSYDPPLAQESFNCVSEGIAYPAPGPADTPLLAHALKNRFLSDRSFAGDDLLDHPAELGARLGLVHLDRPPGWGRWVRY